MDKDELKREGVEVKKPKKGDEPQTFDEGPPQGPAPPPPPPPPPHGEDDEIGGGG